MTLAAIKAELERLPKEEQSFLAAYLRHLGRREDPAYEAELDGLWQRMEAGEKVPLTKVLDLGRQLDQSGA